MYSSVNRSFSKLRFYKKLLCLRGENWNQFDEQIKQRLMCCLVLKNFSTVNPIAFHKKSNRLDQTAIRTASQYFAASKTGLDGPNQILPTDVDTAWEPTGRVRIKCDDQSNAKFELISVPGLLYRTARKYPDRPALVSQPDAHGNRTILTYRDYENQVRTVAKAFLRLGLERHHSVCIIGFNSPQWFVSDLAAIHAGGFAAGIYTTNSPEACQHCAKSSRANIIVVEDDNQLQKILKIRNNLPNLKAIVQYEGVPQADGVLSWSELLEMGQKQSDDQLNQVLKTIGINECCTLVYTSGTTGNPKAVMLSHDNLLTNSQAIWTLSDFKDAQETLISFLPLSHIVLQLSDVYISIGKAATVYMADKNALKSTLLNNLLDVRPTCFFGVPRVWEKIYEKMRTEIQSYGIVTSWMISWARTQVLKHHTNRMAGVQSESLSYKFAKSFVINKVKVSLGLNRCHSFFVGAAPLSTDIKEYFMSFDILVLDGYGMSECGTHSLSANQKYRLGGVGRTLPGFMTKLDKMDKDGEGEICMGGRHVFMGYLNDPEKTKEAKDEDNWLHSGDLGKMDADGFLSITGRSKELIITTGGENVPPVHVEQLVEKECPAVSNCMLVGDKKKYLTMLVALKTRIDAETGQPLDTFSDETLSWAQSLGSASTTVAEVIKTQDPAILKGVADAISRANEWAISNAQRVQKFRILPHDFSLPTGELTPTLKLKRNVVLKKYADLIDEMYKEA